MGNKNITIGLVELPELAAPLEAADLPVATGGTLREAASAIKNHITSGGTPPIIAMNTGANGMKPLLSRIRKETDGRSPVVILTTPGSEPLDVEGATAIDLPSPLSAITDAAGVSDRRFDNVIVDKDGTPRVADSPIDNDVDEWLTDDEDDDRKTEPDPWDDDDGDEQSPTPSTPTEETPDDETAVHATSEPEPPAAPPSNKLAPPPARPTVTATTTATVATVAEKLTDTDDDHRLLTHRANRQDEQSNDADDHAHTRAHAAPVAAAPDLRSVLTQPAIDNDPIDLFGEAGQAPTTPEGDTIFQRPQESGSLAPVLVVFSGKGGVGKTTMALNIAQRAADIGNDLDVTLIDGNRGQGDTRKYLRVPRNATTRSMADATTSTTPASAILSSEELNDIRSQRLQRAGFSIALAPPYEQADVTVADPNAYKQVTHLARQHSDLVVVDTQIIESVDATGIVGQFITPMLESGGWGLAITDTSSAGVSNILDVLKKFSTMGVTSDRMSFLVNRTIAEFSDDNLRAAFSDYATSFARCDNDASIVRQMNVGRFIHNVESVSPIIDHILYRMLGTPEFAPKETKKKRKLFGGRVKAVKK